MSGLPRWIALVPVTAYVIYALLRDEWERVISPCLTAQVTRHHREGKFSDLRLEIRNCGSLPIYQLEWELTEEGWYLAADGIEYPIAELEPGNSKSIYLSITINARAETRITLKGVANDAPYEVEKLISVLG